MAIGVLARQRRVDEGGDVGEVVLDGAPARRGDAEADDAHGEAVEHGADEDVARAEPGVEDPLAVRVLERLEELGREQPRLGDRQRPPREGVERLVGGLLEREEGAAGRRAAAVDDGRDVLVGGWSARRPRRVGDRRLDEGEHDRLRGRLGLTVPK
ncbi:MAG: hypothetical protein H6745_21720 [Deltaproteobacteria bacterium]|nr:hypothetical protein [Deltaproteobacteria bacterium]